MLAMPTHAPTRPHHVRALTLVLAGLLAALALGAGPAAAIRKGSPAVPEEWPFVVALLHPGTNDFRNQFCAGSLVAPTLVLTAAHCVVDEGRQIPARAVQVRPGGARLSAGRGTRIRVAAIRQLSRYHGIGTGWDAAVLVLKQPATTATIRIATAADAPYTAAGVPSRIAGWGDLTDGRGRYPTQLFQAAVPIRSDTLCRRLVGNLYTSASDLCAGVLRAGGPDTCEGDSGGPLIVAGPSGEPVLAGITSSGNGCGRPRSPGVYTRVSTLTGWLRAQGVPIPAPAPPAPPAPASPAPAPAAPAA